MRELVDRVDHAEYAAVGEPANLPQGLPTPRAEEGASQLSMPCAS
jgi:hypothetical protein